MWRGWSQLDDQSRVLMRRLYTAATSLAAVMLVGAAGYHVIGGGRWSFAECFYMAAITLSTVGFAETLPGMETVPGARLWTLLLILLGSGTLLYFASTFTALVVEGDLRGAITRRRMLRMLEHIENHVIVCGVGSTGQHVVQELVASRTPLVVVDKNIERIRRIVTHHQEAGILLVHGDATQDEVLDQAGIRRIE